MLGFKQVPLKLMFSPVLANLTSFERDVMWSAQLGQDERHGLPYDAATLRSIIMPARHFVAIREIAAARDKLVALGVFIHKQTARKEWLEIHQDYRHAQGQNETTFGDETPAAVQGEIPFGPEVVRRVPRNHKRARTESDEKKTYESRAAAEAGNRAKGRREDSGGMTNEDKRAAGWFAQPPDSTAVQPEDRELWGTLWQACGEVEMYDNGCAWLERMEHDRDAMRSALSDLANMSREAKVRNPAAVLTAFWEQSPAGKRMATTKRRTA